jgi:hypothetical protein
MKKEDTNNPQKIKIDDSSIQKDTSNVKPLPPREQKKVDKIVEHFNRIIKKSEENK